MPRSLPQASELVNRNRPGHVKKLPNLIFFHSLTWGNIMTITATLAENVRAELEAKFPKSVDMYPLLGPDNLRSPHYGLWTDSGESVGSAFRAGYTPHTQDDVLALCESAVTSMPASHYVCSARWKDGHHVTIGPSDEYRRTVAGGKDAIFPRFHLQFLYNGSACVATLGLYRDACQNLMMLRSAGASFCRKIRHTSSLREKMPDLISDFRQLAGQWDDLVSAIDRLESRELVLSEYLSRVFPAPEIATPSAQTRASRRIESIIRRIHRERIAVGRPLGSLDRATAWEALNGVQGYVQHDKNRRGRPTASDRAMIALADPTVRIAADTAFSMAG